MFLSNLVDGYEAEARVMRNIASLMNSEFEGENGRSPNFSFEHVVA